MVKRLILALLCGAGLLLAARPARPGESDNVLADELAVKSAGLPVDGAGLLEFFRSRIKGPAAPDAVAALVEQLGSKDGAEREKAAAALVAIGPPAVPALRMAAKDPDAAEAAGLARRCLAALDANSAAVSAAVVRLTAQRRPDGAAAALLAYLPFAEDESVQAEIRAALTGMAYHDGKADPALLKALGDESPLRRSMAVDVLCENGLAEPRDALHKLLADPMPTVRLRAALALAQARDANAVSTLVDLLGELPPAQGRYAEEYLSNLAGDQAPAGAKDGLGDDASRAKVRDAWAGWWKSTEGAAGLAEFTKRTLTEADREKAEKLIRELGDDAYDVRQKAQGDLKTMGVLVVRMLRAAANDPETEISQGARLVLQEIEMDKAAPLSPVAARLVALRKPAGAAEVLLAYLPFCDDEGLLTEVQAALNAVAYPDGKADPALVRALGDKAAVRRGAATEALCFGPLGDNLAAVKKLLKDDQPPVRLQAALALAGGPRDRDAVPVLINLIGEMGGDQSGPAEDYLLRLAADHGPLDLPSGDGAARLGRRDKWAAWWKENGERVALVDRYGPAGAQRYLGYTLLIQPNNNQVIELAADNKTERFKLAGLLGPQDAQALPGDRYLITESNGQRVTERNLKGDVLWTKQVPNVLGGPGYPVSAHRLPNGNTFIVCRNQILECTRDGKDVYVISRPQNDVLTAMKLRNNEIVVVSSQGEVQRIDKAGNKLKGFTIQNTWMVSNDILPNGNVLIALQPPMNKVVEYNADGKPIWESSAVMNPIAAARSPNGNTLIVSQQWPNQIVEVDKNNKEVSRLNQPIYTMRVHRR